MTKLDRIYNLFEDIELWAVKTVIPVRWKIHEMFKKLPQIISLRKFEDLRAGKRSQVDTPSLQRWFQERRQPHRKRILGILKVLFEYSGEYWSAHACKETTWGRRKNYQTVLKRTITDSHTGLGIVPHPSHWIGRPNSSQSTGWSMLSDAS